jgi:two-component system response regulator FixJ
VTHQSTVYLVDDDPNVLRSLRFLLEGDGFQVHSFESAHEFLDRYCHDAPACLVVDLCMPGVNGLELQSELSSRGDFLPIIFVSGQGQIAACANAMKQGAVDFLVKPVDHQTLRNCILTALDQDAERLQLESYREKVAERFKMLTPRELDVLQMLYQGKVMKFIAMQLGVSFQTVAKHRSRLLKKLGINNETDLVRLIEEFQLFEDIAELSADAGDHESCSAGNLDQQSPPSPSTALNTGGSPHVLHQPSGAR